MGSDEVSEDEAAEPSAPTSSTAPIASAIAATMSAPVPPPASADPADLAGCEGEPATQAPAPPTTGDGGASAPARQKRPRPRLRQLTSEPSAAGAGALSAASPAAPSSTVEASASTGDAALLAWAQDLVAENSASESDDRPGYWQGLNIKTGRTIEEEEAARAREGDTRRSHDGGGGGGGGHEALVSLSYGSYQGVQLSASELRRIKAQEAIKSAPDGARVPEPARSRACMQPSAARTQLASPRPKSARGAAVPQLGPCVQTAAQ
eukprot:5794344-Prymnesium_polylepis.1